MDSALPGEDGLKRRAAAGVAALMARRVVAQLITIVGTTLLMRLLSVEEFGIYAIVLFVVTLGGYFADAGLGAALVQRKQEITQQDLSIVFTVQFTLLSLATLVIALAAPWIQEQYDLPEYAAPLLTVLSLSLLISSFKTVPAIILERRLDYHRLSASDIIEMVTFQGVAVLMALSGMGVWSFVVAAICQAAAGSIVLYALCRWRPQLNFGIRQARHLLRFGLLYQGRTMINVIKDNVTPTLIALTSGPLAVGYIGFAQKLSSYPLMIEAATSRVAFPAYSRIQDDLPRLKSAIEKTLKLVNLMLLPLTGLLMALAEPLTRLVLGGDKWLPALPAFYLFSVANLAAGTSNVLVTSLYAFGRAGAVLRLSIFWAIATWTLAAPLVLWLGWIGFPIAIALLAVTVILPVYEVRKSVRVNPIQPLVKPALSTLAAVAVVLLLGELLNNTVLGLALNGLIGLATYVACMLLIDRQWLAGELLSSLPESLSARLLRTPLSRVLAPGSVPGATSMPGPLGPELPSPSPNPVSSSMASDYVDPGRKLGYH